MDKRAAVIVTASAGVGLFVAHIFSELVPDALAIGVCMFAAGALGGFVCGVCMRARGASERDAAGRVTRGLEWIGKRIKDDDE